ncbi:MAG: hypothetical protein JWN69_515 [Alphaproteobacteria bacterium]|nr:hypothetical protein [Alphaproteobacteria bacterium]
MQKILRVFAAASVAAFLPLAACNQEPEVINAGPPDTQAKDLAAAAPVELPPSIAASRTYRCKDNSLVYIDFMSNQTANYRTSKSGEPVVLTAPAQGQPYVADGYSVSSSGTEINLTAPGKGSQSCKA